MHTQKHNYSWYGSKGFYPIKEILVRPYSSALFPTAKKGKQPDCLSSDEWITKKMWGTLPMEFYSAVKMELENVI